MLTIKSVNSSSLSLSLSLSLYLFLPYSDTEPKRRGTYSQGNGANRLACGEGEGRQTDMSDKPRKKAKITASIYSWNVT